MEILATLFGKSFAGEPLPGSLQLEEGFVDIDLPIVSANSQQNGARRVVARGKIGTEVVAIAVGLSSSWKPQPLENTSAVVHWGSATIESLGSDSDRLIGLLVTQYGLPASDAKAMLPRASAEVVGLGTNPATLDTSPAKMKFFLHSNEEERYAEVFVNIDLQRGWLEIHEKDPEYRRNLVRALTET